MQIFSMTQEQQLMYLILFAYFWFGLSVHCFQIFIYSNVYRLLENNKNNNIQHLLNIHNMPSPMLSISQILSYFILKVTLLDRDYYPHSIENKTETLIFVTVQLCLRYHFRDQLISVQHEQICQPSCFGDIYSLSRKALRKFVVGRHLAKLSFSAMGESDL